MANDSDIRILHIKFAGSTMDTGHVDAVDFAHTVSASAELLKFIAKGVESTKDKEVSVDLIATREGSFEADLAIVIRDIAEVAPALIPLLIDGRVISSTKQLIDIFKQLIQVKKFLKGEKPNKIEIVQNNGSPHVAIHGNSGTINVNVATYNLLQTEGASKKLHKIVQPLLKEDAELDSIEILEENEESVQISKPEAHYFEKEEELQMIEHKVRGIITAMDRKTYNGKISISDKRINFEIEIEDIKKLDKVVDGLIESMKNKIAITIMGEAAFDFESNLKHIKIKDIEKDSQLFDS